MHCTVVCEIYSFSLYVLMRKYNEIMSRVYTYTYYPLVVPIHPDVSGTSSSATTSDSLIGGGGGVVNFGFCFYAPLLPKALSTLSCPPE